MIPEWAVKHKIKGTVLRKKTEDTYYLIKVHSERRFGVKYPVLVQDEIIGTITCDGIKYNTKKVVDLLDVEITLFSNTKIFISLTESDKIHLNKVYVFRVNEKWYFSKLTEFEKNILSNNGIYIERGLIL